MQMELPMDPKPEKTRPRSNGGYFFLLAKDHEERFGAVSTYIFTQYSSLERAREVAEKIKTSACKRGTYAGFFVMEHVVDGGHGVNLMIEEFA